MTKSLDLAIERVRKLTADRQDEAAKLLSDWVDHDPTSTRLTDAQVAEIERRLCMTEDTVPHTEVRALFEHAAE